MVALSYPVVIQIAAKLCNHSINAFMAFWLSVSVVAFFMIDCRKSLKETWFYRDHCNRSLLKSYIPPEDYSRGLVMTAIQSFIYSMPMLALGFITPFDDNGLRVFWGLMVILAVIYGNIGAWYSSKRWEIATWKQFGLTCWVPLPMLLVVIMWLMIFNVNVNNEITIIFANMISSGLSVLAILYFRSGMRKS